MNVETVRQNVSAVAQLREKYREEELATAQAAAHPWSATLQTVAQPAGRALLAAIFLLSAFGKLTSFSGTAAFMESKGVPFAPFFLVVSLLLESLGGLSVLIGYKTRVGALALLAFLIPVTFVIHNFWAFSGQEQQMQMINFLKNVSIMGGLTLLFAFGGGKWSLDARAARE